MADTLAQFAKLLKPIGGKPDNLVAIKVHPRSVSITEVHLGAAHIEVKCLNSTELPRAVDVKNIGRSQDMIVEAIRTLKEETPLTTIDAAISIPSHLIQMRIINLPYVTEKELAKEAKNIEFWIENEPDIEKMENPFIEYQPIVISENDDLARVLLCFAETAAIQPWVDLLLAAHLNPVFIDPEVLSLVNLRINTLPLDEQKQNQAIIQISPHECQCIAFSRTKIHRVKLEISEFDLVLLEYAEQVSDITSPFWDDVMGRVTKTVKQAMLYLQEEQDFQPFATVHFASEYAQCENTIALLKDHFTLAPVVLWNPLVNLRLNKAADMKEHPNPSMLASIFGTASQRLNIYGKDGRSNISINMLPKHKILRRNRQLAIISRTFRRIFASTAIALGLWIIGLSLPQYISSLSAIRNFENLKTEAETTQSQFDAATAGLKEAARNIDQMRMLQNPSGKTYLLETLPDLMPEGAELKELHVKNSSKIELEGYANSDKAVFVFENELALSGLIKNITLNTKQNANDGLIAFTLSGDLGITE